MLIRSSSLSRPQLLMANSQLSNAPVASTDDPRLNESKKFHYQVHQQVKLLHLQAEVELLLQQQQCLRQQRIATIDSDGNNGL